MRLDEFPRPAHDNGRGLHWSPSPHSPSGGALDFWIDELHAMHITWLKLLDDGRGSSLTLCRRLIAEGIVPIVRLASPGLQPRRLTPEEKETIRRLVDVGVRYFEIDSEPDLPARWGEAMPANWFDIVIDNFIEDAEFILQAGGFPAVPAMALRPDRNPIRAIVERGRGDLFERGTWWAIHAYTLNRPLDYPDDPVNRTGQPVSEDEYEQHYPWGWNEPREVIDRWRAEGKQPTSTLADDPFCFRAYELAGQLAQDVLGFPIPIIATEGGAVTGWRDDRRYPRLDPWTAAEWTVRINEFLQRAAPPWFFTLCHWLIADRRIDPSRPHAWEPHCWYTHWWDEQFGFNGVLPVVERVKAMPSLERPRPQPVPETRVSAPVAPPTPSEEEEIMPRSGIITGRVIDEQGTPLAGVEVELRAEGGEVFSSVTDDQGNFHFPDLAPGTYRLLVVGRGEVGTVDVRAGEAHIADISLSTTLEPAPPVEEAPPPEEELPSPVEPEMAEAHVEAAVEERAGEEVAPAVDVPEAAEEVPEEEVAAPAPEGEAAPAREEEVTVITAGAAAGSRVIGTAPGARAGIPMRLTAQDGETWETVLDEERRFAFVDLPPGTYRLEMVGIGTVREGIELDGRNTVEVEFPLRGVIQGLVMGGTPEMMAELISETYGWKRAVALSPQGQYRFIELPPGTYRVNVEGHLLGPVTIGGDETTTMPVLDLRPPHRASLRGKVTGPDGGVLPDVQVRLMRGGDIVAETRTALNGSYAFENMPPGDYHLVAVGPTDTVRSVHLEQDQVVVLDITLPAAEITAPPVAEKGPSVEAPAVEEAPAVPEEGEAAEEAAREEGASAEEVVPAPPQAAEPVPEEEGVAEPVAVPSAEAPPTREEPMAMYVLLPPPHHPLSRAVLLAALPFLRRSRSVAGFRVEEAQAARQVLLVGDESVYPPEVEAMLREAGCEVDRVSGDVSELFVMFRESARAFREGGQA